MTTETTLSKKTPLTKRAFWHAVLFGTILLVNLITFFVGKTVITAENYATLIPIRNTIRLTCLITLCIVLILSIKRSSNPEKEDELARLHRYQAGYISFYIFLLAVILLICFVRNFESVFTGDFIDIMFIPYMLYAFSQCLENIVFIYLEKHNLE